MYWIAHALLIDLHQFWWVVPFAVIGIPIVLSIFIGVMSLITMRLMQVYEKLEASFAIKGLPSSPHQSLGHFICMVGFSSNFACLWLLVEIVRSYIILPFPWNLLGYVTSSYSALSQLGSVIGVYGLSYLVAFISCALYSRNRGFRLLMVALLFSCLFWGKNRIGDIHQPNLTKAALSGEDAPSQRIQRSEVVESRSFARLVQPNISWEHIIDPSKRKLALEKIVALSANKNRPNYLIWPESGIPFVIEESVKSIPGIPRLFHDYMITGVDIYDRGQEKVFNSIIAIDGNNSIVSEYHKRILVPFGEYIPWHDLFKYLPRIPALSGEELSEGMSQQHNFVFHDVGNTHTLKIAPFLCYEIIFSLPFFADNVKDANCLLNITNDMWFGKSVGPYQHLAMAVMRAIEYGLPLIRVANTGISAVISNKGIIIDYIPMDKEGYIDVDISTLEGINASFKTKIETPYRQYGCIPVVCMIIALQFILYCGIAYVVDLKAVNPRSKFK